MAWRKSWCKQNLDANGTKRRLTPEQRSVWDDVLDLAEMAPITGTLCIAEGAPYTIEQLSAIFQSPKPLVEDSLRVFRKLGMIDDHWRIVNWPKYQNDYQRQKPHRERTS